MERNIHYCQANLFVNTFASLYVNKHKQERLFKCKHFAIKKIMSQIESHKKMMRFVKYIREKKLNAKQRIKMDNLKIIYDDKRPGVPETIEESKEEDNVLEFQGGDNDADSLSSKSAGNEESNEEI